MTISKYGEGIFFSFSRAIAAMVGGAVKAGGQAVME